MREIDVIYEDNHILVLNKPAGLLTQPTDDNPDSLETQAKKWLKEKHQKPGNVFLHVVHRLDKPVSGIVVCAKTSKALSRLNASMRSKEIKKVYHALVEGTPKNPSGTLENYLKHDDHRAYVCTSSDKDAKLARLHYRVLKTTKNRSLLEIHLETGRYHQIRCQCAFAGFPIVGDTKYGAKPAPTYNGIYLHHAEFEMIHPTTGTNMTFKSKNESEEMQNAN